LVDDVEIDSGDKCEIQFTPKLYLQRYDYVLNELQRHNDTVRKIVDFGCSEFGFFRRFKNHFDLDVAEYVGVDISRTTLKANLAKLHIPTYERLNPCRNVAMKVSIYHGNLLEFDSRLLDADAVLLIEV
jgi:hypothetical protein